ARDPDGTAFQFAALDSDAFRAAVGEEQRQSLPDSSVVLTHDGRLLVKSAGVIHILRRLGGGWRLLGEMLRIVPKAILNLGYDTLAAVRYWLFHRPKDACPLMPPDLRRRFLA